MKEDIKALKEKINETAAQNKRWKLWDRRPYDQKTDPFPGFANKLRATILCMVLAHARGKLHCRTVWGKDEGRREELSSLEDQRRFVEKHLATRMAPTWKVPLDDEEIALAKKLLDWGRHATRSEVAPTEAAPDAA